jgi:hypothetical protein
MFDITLLGGGFESSWFRLLRSTHSSDVAG